MPPDSTRPRALVLAPETPYPLAGGGALRSASLLQYLARSYDVDLVVFQQPGAPDPAAQIPEGLTQRVTAIELPPTSRGMMARRIRNAMRAARRVPPLIDRFSGFGNEVAAAVEGRRYEVGVIEHFWCAPYWEQIAPVCRRTVLNLHNIESSLHQRCADTEGGTAGIAHRIFHGAAEELEQAWFPRFSEILTTSDPDAELVRRTAGCAKVTVYPNSIPWQPLPVARPEEAVVFSGNLEYHPNKSAVRFFRREIWPQLREKRPALFWRLVGKNPEAVKAWTEGDPRIQVRGAVEDAVSELARAQVAVVPLLAGSGTRLKILEAWAACLPVVSTRIGAEGLPVQDGEHLLVADGAAEFTNAVSRLLEDSALRQKIGVSGRQLFEQQFTWENAWKSLTL